MGHNMGLKATLALLIGIGIAIIAASLYFLQAGTAMFIWSGVGLALIVVAGAGLIFSNLYVKVSSTPFLNT